jgi:hypothetical protein
MLLSLGTVFKPTRCTGISCCTGISLASALDPKLFLAPLLCSLEDFVVDKEAGVDKMTPDFFLASRGSDTCWNVLAVDESLPIPFNADDDGSLLRPLAVDDVEDANLLSKVLE